MYNIKIKQTNEKMNLKKYHLQESRKMDLYQWGGQYTLNLHPGSILCRAVSEFGYWSHVYSRYFAFLASIGHFPIPIPRLRVPKIKIFIHRIS